MSRVDDVTGPGGDDTGEMRRLLEKPHARAGTLGGAHCAGNPAGIIRFHARIYRKQGREILCAGQNYRAGSGMIFPAGNYKLINCARVWARPRARLRGVVYSYQCSYQCS